VQYAPTRGRYKVYLIDEVHMLSAHSFNALLKTLEEPPPHVKFLLATTDPQKLPVTVLSRCLQFNLKRLPPGLIQERLDAITKAEGIAAEAGALRQIALAARGSMRDALSLLDQAIAYCGGTLRAPEVRSMLGGIDREDARRILAALARNDGPQLMGEVARLDESAPDYDVVLDELATLLQSIALAQVVPEAVPDEDERRALAPLLAVLAPEDVQLYYQIALLGRRDLPLTSDPRVGFEMTLLRMLAFRREDANAPAPAPIAAPAGAPPAAAPAPRADAGDWMALLDALPLQGAARQLAAHCVLQRRQGAALHLRLDRAHEHLLTAQQQERLRAALSARFGQPVELRIEIGEPDEETPARRDARLAGERRQDARATLERDPNVVALQSELGATLVQDSVEPLG
jgi:DNA polymerase-3 subunit gamma/tau